MATTQPPKDTVYIDVDDEITTIIDKVNASTARIVALVLPKRAAVLQSVVNMKLLKRSADEAKKQVVLITAEAGLLPLAGAVGLPVANTLQSKPEIPSVPSPADELPPEEEALMLDDEADTSYTAENAGDRPVGELAGKSATGAAAGGLVITSGVDTEDTPPSAASRGAAPAAALAGSAAGKAAKKNGKLKVPNFNRFRTRLAFLIIGLVLLIFLAYLALVVLPKATVAIGTNAQDINSSLNVTLDTTASHVDLSSSTVPATAAQQQKTYTKQVDATGKENKGNKATGSVTMTTCATNPAQLQAVPAGTGVSANGQTYITQDDANFGYDANGNCSNGGFPFRSNSVDITAQQGGANYNVSSGTDFSVSGRSDVSATGSASGGTDDIRQVVSQSDIDNAKGQINLKDDSIKQTLIQQLKQDNLFPITATFKASDPNVTTSSQVGDEASTVTVTESVTYTMFGTARSNLLQLIKNDVSQQIDTSQQAILDDGLNQASFSLRGMTDTSAKVDMENTALVGPKIDINALKQQIAGKKSGEAKDIITQLPGVTDANVKLSPFWLSSVPKNPDKITIKVGKASKHD